MASAQRLTVGVKGGASLNEPTQFSHDDSQRYVVGASAEFGAWHGLSLEVDFLYRRNRMTHFAFELPQAAAAHVYELPILAKYTFRRDARLQPFVAGGTSFRKADIETTSRFAVDGLLQEVRSSGWSPLDVGAVAAAGVTFRWGPVKISPEIRYVRWGGHTPAVLSRDQADFLLGIAF